MADQLPQLLKRLETVTIRLEELATKPQSINAAAVSVASGKDGDSATNSSPSLRAYQGLLDGPLASFLTLSKTVGGAVADQSQYVKTAFDLLQQLLVTATKSKKPSAEQMQVSTTITSNSVNTSYNAKSFKTNAGSS
jgi:adenylyl cyclase-associated protein